MFVKGRSIAAAHGRCPPGARPVPPGAARLAALSVLWTLSAARRVPFRPPARTVRCALAGVVGGGGVVLCRVRQLASRKLVVLDIACTKGMDKKLYKPEEVRLPRAAACLPRAAAVRTAISRATCCGALWSVTSRPGWFHGRLRPAARRYG